MLIRTTIMAEVVGVDDMGFFPSHSQLAGVLLILQVALLSPLLSLQQTFPCHAFFHLLEI